jgi:hypothetical protein
VTLAVGLLRLHHPVLLVYEQLAGRLAPRQLLGVDDRLALGIVRADGPAFPSTRTFNSLSA